MLDEINERREWEYEDFSDLSDEQVIEVNKVIQEAMTNARFFEHLHEYRCTYFFFKDSEKYSVIVNRNLDSFTGEVQRKARQLLGF